MQNTEPLEVLLAEDIAGSAVESILITGASGSGKSFLAALLAERRGGVRLELDEYGTLLKDDQGRYSFAVDIPDVVKMISQYYEEGTSVFSAGKCDNSLLLYSALASKEMLTTLVLLRPSLEVFRHSAQLKLEALGDKATSYPWHKTLKSASTIGNCDFQRLMKIRMAADLAAVFLGLRQQFGVHGRIENKFSSMIPDWSSAEKMNFSAWCREILPFFSFMFEFTSDLIPVRLVENSIEYESITVDGKRLSTEDYSSCTDWSLMVQRQGGGRG